jgi:hypothetical protein
LSATSPEFWHSHAQDSMMRGVDLNAVRGRDRELIHYGANSPGAGE